MISLDTQLFYPLRFLKLSFFRMVRDTTLPIEYCAYMVAIMVTRYEMDDRDYKIQQANEIVAEKLNSSWMGQKSDFYVTTSALHHGIFLFKKSLITLGYEVIEMHGKEKQLQDFMSLQGGKRGYEVKFPNFKTSSLSLNCTEEIFNNAILVNRDYILLRSNYKKSIYTSCSSLFMELFVDIEKTIEKNNEKEETFMSPITTITQSSFKVRKSIDNLSDRSIKNNGKRILEYVEKTYGLKDTELYITAAYDLIVKKNRRNNTPELRQICYLEEEDEIKRNKHYDEEIFDNDMRVVKALRDIKKKNVVMSSEEKCQILTVFDAVKSALKEIDIADIDQESALASYKLLQSHNGLCNVSIRSIVRLNENREIILKQRGIKVQTDFEAEVWGNLMLCYYETNDTMVSTILRSYINCTQLLYLRTYIIKIAG